MSTARSQNAQLRSAPLICQALCGVVRGLFGPCGRDILVETRQKQVIVTNHGMTALSCVQASHPLARVMLDAAALHHSVYGSGGSAFLLALSEALHCFVDSGLPPVSIRRGLASASRMLRTPRSDAAAVAAEEVPPQPLVAQGFSFVAVSSAAYAGRLKEVLTTHFGRALPGVVVGVLVPLLAELVRATCGGHSNPLRGLQWLLDSKQRGPLLAVSGAHVHASSLQEGVFLHKSVANFHGLASAVGAATSTASAAMRAFVHTGVLEQCEACFLSCEVSVDAGDVQVDVHSQQAYTDLVSHGTRVARAVAVRLRERGVHLVLSRVMFSPAQLQVFADEYLAVVHNVPRDLLRQTAAACGAAVVGSLETLCAVVGSSGENAGDREKKGRESCSVRLRRCRVVAIGRGNAFVNLSPAPREDGLVAHTLLLRAPSGGLAAQYETACFNALALARVAHTAPLQQKDADVRKNKTKSSGGDSKEVAAKHKRRREGLFVVPGGGAWELAVCRLLISASDDPVVAMVAQSLLAVPRQLHRNACRALRGAAANRAFVQLMVQSEGEARTQKPEEMPGFAVASRASIKHAFLNPGSTFSHPASSASASRASLSRPGARGVWESSTSKDGWLAALLDTLMQIVCVDAIVPVKPLVTKFNRQRVQTHGRRKKVTETAHSYVTNYIYSDDSDSDSDSSSGAEY
jgi:chaperonin GroEL (HSP60 family)